MRATWHSSCPRTPSRWSRSGRTSLREPYRERGEGSIRGVEEPRAEIRGAPAVDDGRADHVRPFLQGEAPGDAVVDDGLPIAVDADDLLAVHPPDGSRIGADGEAHPRRLRGRMDDRHRPEEDVRRGFALRAREVEQVDVV